MIRRRSLLATAAAGLVTGSAFAQAPTKPAKARELRFGYQRSGTLLIAKQQGVLEKRLKPLGVDARVGADAAGKIDAHQAEPVDRIIDHIDCNAAILQRHRCARPPTRVRGW